MTYTSVQESAVAGGGTQDRARWVMLTVLLAGQFMALLDVTIVNVAMPTIGRSLHASGAELQLVVAGYTVSYAMLLITGARLGDLIGRRRMFLLGVGVFTLASLTCGLAPDTGVLIGARFVQGAGAAAMMPQIMTVIQLRFSGAARARALSAYTAVLSSGFVAGQVIGGALVTADLFGSAWRPVFLINVPLGAAVLALLPRVMPADTPSKSRRLDPWGLAIAVPAVCLVVLPLMLGHQEHWPAWTLACIACGLALVPAFLYTERLVASHGGHPLLSLAVFRSPGLLSGLTAMTLLMVSYGGFLFSFAVDLQAGQGDTALRAGLTFAPCAAAFGLCGYFWRRVPASWHPYLTMCGAAVGAVGYAAVGLVLRSGGSGGLWLQVFLVVLGGSLALAFSPLVTHALVRVPLQQAADASGLLTTAIQLSQAVGVAVFGSLFLTLDAGRTESLPEISGHALFVTLTWTAVTLACGTIAASPLARTVRAAALQARELSGGGGAPGAPPAVPCAGQARELAEAAAGARVIVLSSRAHRRSDIMFGDPNYRRRPYDPWEAYGQSKTANALFAVGVTRQHAADGITANALMPGAINTGLQGHLSDSDLRSLGWVQSGGTLAPPAGWKTIPQDAATTVWAALAPELEGSGGHYLEDCAIAPPWLANGNPPNGHYLPYALDPGRAALLWDLSAKLTREWP